MIALASREASLGIGPARDELRRMVSHCRAPKIRTMREFAEQEIIIPEGPFKGRPFKVSRQPFAGLWLGAVDRTLAYHPQNRYSRVCTTGPSQSGKTMLTSNVPLLFHLFEMGEAVGYALPSMDMAQDKWTKDILPVIEKTRFRDLLPSRGEGSQGGKVKNMVCFKNGATLKFFSAGGSDKSRAGITVRVLVITEANAFGGSAETSNESSKLEQLFARSQSFGSSALAYIECTVEIETDVIWSNYQAGTASKIACPCPHCRAFVSPEREHLQGWQEAQDVIEAGEKAHFVCPSCQARLSDDERRTMNEQAMLVHKGQSITLCEEIPNRKSKIKNPPTPLILGEPPRTNTLGFRWSGFNNLFLTSADLAAREWDAARAVDDDAAERKMCQFVWCNPHQGDTTELVTLHPHTLAARQAKTPKAVIPQETKLVTVQIDVGKWKCWWQAIAWQDGATGVVFDYGSESPPSNELGEERAIALVLRDLRQKFETGWAWQGSPNTRAADLVGIDAGYQGKDEAGNATTVVYDFVRECQKSADTRDRYYPTKGFGHGQLAGNSYSAPKKTGGQVRTIGEGYHISWLPARGVALVEFDSDFWKSHFHERLACEASQSGAITLFADIPKTHHQITRHWTAEKRQEQYIPGKGTEVCWVSTRRGNHQLDASVGNCVLAHFGGIRVLPKPKQTPQPPAPNSQPSVHTPDGRPYSILDR